MLMAPEQLRQAMRHWTTGVSVITSVAGGHMHGMTVNSFTSVSLEPPLVTVSLAIAARTCSLVLSSGIFAVSVLSAGQREISERFAGRVHTEEDRFLGLNVFVLESGAPFIAGGLAYLDCRVVQAVPLGPSTLFLGEVIAAEVEPEGQPLVYHNRRYFGLADEI